LAQTYLPHQFRHRLSTRKLRDARWKIGVSLFGVFSDFVPNPGKDSSEVKLVNLLEYRESWLGKFQDRNGPTRSTNPDHLTQPLERIDYIPQAERDADGLELVVLKREARRIGLKKGQAVAVKTHLALLLGGESEHLPTKIASNDRSLGVKNLGSRQCQIPSSSANIQKRIAVLGGQNT
jgi:hypothetical protein